MSEELECEVVLFGVIMEFVLDIVLVYVSNNLIQSGEFLDFICEVYIMLFILGNGVVWFEVKKLVVLIKKLIMDEFLICFEDGKKFKLLKCYLCLKYGFILEEYCEKWGLLYDYLMVVLSYVCK